MSDLVFGLVIAVIILIFCYIMAVYGSKWD